MNASENKGQSWWQLLSIQAGGTICLPVMMAGQLICQKYGWPAALLGMGLGNLFLLVLGYLLAALSSHRPQSTVEHARFYFGKKGALFFASLMIFSMLGWFGIQLNIMSLGLQQLLGIMGHNIATLPINVCLGIIISSLMCGGMKAMKCMTHLSAPLLGLTLIYTMYYAQGTISQTEPLTFSWLGGLSLIIGANMAAVIDLPTFFRHAKSGIDARICIFLLYGLVVPLIEGAGIYLTAVSKGNSLLEVMQFGHGLLWLAWISFFVIFSGWSTNNTNLYSAVASSYSLPGNFNPILRTLFLGVVGTFIACLNPLGNIEDVLDIFSVAVGGMGAVILASYLLEINHKEIRTTFLISIISWSVGMAISFSCMFFHWFLTGAPAFDAFVASFILQWTLNFFYQRKVSYETIDNR